MSKISNNNFNFIYEKNTLTYLLIYNILILRIKDKDLNI